MYKFKVINIQIPEKEFKEICFLAVNDARMKSKDANMLPMELVSNQLVCKKRSRANYDIMNDLKYYMGRRRYDIGVDYTINVLIDD